MPPPPLGPLLTNPSPPLFLHPAVKSPSSHALLPSSAAFGGNFAQVLFNQFTPQTLLLPDGGVNIDNDGVENGNDFGVPPTMLGHRSSTSTATATNSDDNHDDDAALSSSLRLLSQDVMFNMILHNQSWRK